MAGPALAVVGGLRDAADARGGAAHRVVPAVVELRQAGGARVARAVACRGTTRGRRQGASERGTRCTLEQENK